MDDPRTPEAWYRALPPLTRFTVTVSFLVTLLTSLGLLDPRSILLDWSLVVRKFQVWRLLTDFFFGGSFSFMWLMHMYFLVTFSSKLEANEMFHTSPGAYLAFLVYQALSLDVLSLILYWPTGKPLMAPAMSMAIMYYWSRREPFGQCGVWGFQIPAYQLPFVMLFMDLLVGNNLLVGLMGLITGHFYYFVKDVLPVERGFDILRVTPYVFDEIMRRAAMFDVSNLAGSAKALLLGMRPQVRTAQTQNENGRNLFSGQGYRISGIRARSHST